MDLHILTNTITMIIYHLKTFSNISSGNSILNVGSIKISGYQISSCSAKTEY